MSCKTCAYMKQRNYVDQNGIIQAIFNVCVARKGEPKVNPYDTYICKYYKDRFSESNPIPTEDEPITSNEAIRTHKAPIVKQEAPRVNKKCVWLNKKGECVADEHCIVTNPECDGCEYFEESKYDPVSRPDHYTAGRKYEPKDVIRDWNLNFNLGNAVKYISRAGRKNDLIEDLKKARQYLDFEIEYLEKKFGMRF